MTRHDTHPRAVRCQLARLRRAAARARARVAAGATVTRLRAVARTLAAHLAPARHRTHAAGAGHVSVTRAGDWPALLAARTLAGRVPGAGVDRRVPARGYRPVPVHAVAACSPADRAAGRRLEGDPGRSAAAPAPRHARARGCTPAVGRVGIERVFDRALWHPLCHPSRQAHPAPTH